MMMLLFVCHSIKRRYTCCRTFLGYAWLLQLHDKLKKQFKNSLETVLKLF